MLDGYVEIFSSCYGWITESDPSNFVVDCIMHIYRTGIQCARLPGLGSEPAPSCTDGAGRENLGKGGGVLSSLPIKVQTPTEQ